MAHLQAKAGMKEYLYGQLRGWREGGQRRYGGTGNLWAAVAPRHKGSEETR